MFTCIQIPAEATPPPPLARRKGSVDSQGEQSNVREYKPLDFRIDDKVVVIDPRHRNKGEVGYVVERRERSNGDLQLKIELKNHDVGGLQLLPEFVFFNVLIPCSHKR